MDDPKTHHILDALADLFLTYHTAPPGLPGTPAPECSGASGSVPGSMPRPQATSPPAIDPLAVPPAPPVPLRLPPKLTPVSAASNISQPDRESRDSAPDVIGSIGTPRTRSMRDQPPPPLRAGAGPHLQAVILGSLPGFALPWLTQYAHHLASTVGPMLLLRVDQAGLTLDRVIAQRGPAAETVKESGGFSSSRATGPVEVLDRLFNTAIATGGAAGLLVQAEDVGVLGHLHLPRVTLVCGAYESALQDGAMKLRELVSRLIALGRPLPELGVMFMGSDAQRSQEAHAQLNRLLEDCLAAPIPLRGWQQQMVPVHVQALGQFSHDPQQDRDLRAYLEELAALAPASASAVSSHAPSPSPQAAQPVESCRPVSGTAVDSSRQAGAGSRTTAAMPGDSISPSLQAFSASAALTEPATQALAQEHDHGPDLAALMAPILPGALPLQARCPRHPATTFLLDTQGRLHLVRRCGPDRDGWAQAVVGLVETQQWVREHFELIQLTQRQCRFDPAQSPTLHLLAEDAPLAVKLTQRLGNLLRIHLLQPVSVGHASTWLCTPLS